MDIETKQVSSKVRTDMLEIRRLGVFLGARITGIDLTKTLSDETVDSLKLAHAQHGVLVFTLIPIGMVVNLIILVVRIIFNLLVADFGMIYLTLFHFNMY